MDNNLDLPDTVPAFINDLFVGIHRQDNLPVGVYKPPEEDIYFPVSYFKDGHEPLWDTPYINAAEAHKHFQLHFSMTLRVALQHYNFSPLYHEQLAKGIRLLTEEIENDLKEGRESKL